MSLDAIGLVVEDLDRAREFYRHLGLDPFADPFERNERGVTLIVLGLTGKNVFARLLAGNVPVELIKNTRIPVLLLPPDHKGNI